MKTIKGIKKAVSFLNKQCVFGRIYLNTKTNEVIAMQYADVNSYTQFDDSNIIYICQYNAREGKIDMKTLREKIEKKC